MRSCGHRWACVQAITGVRVCFLTVTCHQPHVHTCCHAHVYTSSHTHHHTRVCTPPHMYVHTATREHRHCHNCVHIITRTYTPSHVCTLPHPQTHKIYCVGTKATTDMYTPPHVWLHHHTGTRCTRARHQMVDTLPHMPAWSEVASRLGARPAHRCPAPQVALPSIRGSHKPTRGAGP